MKVISSILKKVDNEKKLGDAGRKGSFSLHPKLSLVPPILPF